tara:strand:- start:150 stop:503 length:354 start_codon:yes stop_codon:yes gene_type:complete
MIKYIIYTKKENFSIMEVDCEKILPIEDPSVLLLPNNEWCARIIKPSIFNKTLSSNKDNSSCEIWYSHFLFDSIEEALIKLEKMVREDFKFNFMKNNVQFSEIDIQKVLNNVQHSML